jgi:hypothetical protein
VFSVYVCQKILLNLSWIVRQDSFQAGVAASDGDQHIAVRSTYADFQTDPPRTYLTQAELGAAYGAMTGIAPIGDWTFAGMKDLLANQNSDFDYNDLIFGFLGIAPPVGPVPGADDPFIACGRIGRTRCFRFNGRRCHGYLAPNHPGHILYECCACVRCTIII